MSNQIASEKPKLMLLPSSVGIKLMGFQFGNNGGFKKFKTNCLAEQVPAVLPLNTVHCRLYVHVCWSYQGLIFSAIYYQGWIFFSTLTTNASSTESHQPLFSLLYAMPVPRIECQHPEAWPTSTYGHLRGVSLTFQVLLRFVLNRATVSLSNLFLFTQ